MSEYLKENKNSIKNACLIYSMWDGYVRDDWKDSKQRDFKNYLVDELHMDYFPIHTSGHASIEAIKTLDRLVNPNKVIVIHTEKNDATTEIEKEIFQNRLLNFKDGDVIDLKEDKKMKIKNYSLDQLRKDYANSGKFIIRIRQQNKEKSKKDCKDIVYCEGIKAFYVENKECSDNTVSITIPDNIYKINQTNLRNIINDTKNLKDIDKNINDFIKSKAILKEELEPYFKKTITEGYFKFGKVFIDGKKDIKEHVIKRLELLEEKLENIGTGFDLQQTISQLENIKSKQDKILFKLKNIENLSSLYLTKIEALMILYTTFTLRDKELKTDKHSGMALPEFHYVSSFNTIDYATIEKFNEKIEKAISNYEESTKVELEKKYQHSFMIKNKLSYYTNLCSVIPFEEEYYTSEKEDDSKDDDTSDKRGRIDCIFVNPKENESDIYLIELKVNEGVIGEVDNLDEHGINTHLVDINNLLNNKNKLNLTTFLENIKNRYNYRNEILGSPSRISDTNKYKLHYWIICAINGKNKDIEAKHAKAVLEKIAKLKKDKDIRRLKVTNLLEENCGKCYLESTDGIKIELKLLFNIWKSQGNMNENKFLTIKEIKDYYKI